MTSTRDSAGRQWWVAAAVVPALVVFWCGACFVWNHFYVGPPYLLDSGWYSSIIYRQGVFPSNPRCAHNIPEYYGIHVSPLVSIASIASYAFPGDRISWYVLFQGAIYAPLALAVPALFAKKAPATATLSDGIGVGLASLAFALGGQVWACIGYPHYEIAVSVGICLFLAGAATDRKALAWLGVAIATGTREDGGFHAASFTIAALLCGLLGRPFPLARKHIARMTAAALVAAVIMFVVQKKGFHAADLFRHEYIGEPAFGHLSSAVLLKRSRLLLEDALVVVLPLVATSAIAVWRRDVRYLLGWAAELHWLLLNFLAAQELKASFAIYTGFPFVASVFWIAAYGAIAEPRGSRARVLTMLAFPSLLATLGLWLSLPIPFGMIAKAALVPGSSAPGELRAFARPLRADPRAYGNVIVDHHVAAWTVESMPPEQVVSDGSNPEDAHTFDGLLFYNNGLTRGWFERAAVAASFFNCGRLVPTSLFYCTSQTRSVPPGLTPSSLMLSSMTLRGGARNEGEAVVVPARLPIEVAVFGPFVELARGGRHRATWHARARSCTGPDPRMLFDVHAAGVVLGQVELASTGGVAEIEFEAPERVPLELRSWTGSCEYVIEGVTLARP